MPYDPLAQAEQEQQRAEQNSASPSSSPEAQQAAAEHAVRAQRSYESSPSHQAATAHAAAREVEKAQQTALEGHYRSQGIPTWTGADGNIYPDDRKASEQAAKEQDKQAKAAADLDAKTQQADAIRSGRRHATNPVDKTPIYLESEQQLESRRQTEADKLRKQQLDEQIKSAEAEHGATTAQQQLQGIKPLSETARKKVEEKALPKAKQEAALALQTHYQGKAGATDKAGWWDMVNNNPTPEAQEAKQHLERLAQPNPDITDDDMNVLSQDVSTKPHAAAIQNLQTLLAKDDEVKQQSAAHAARVADLKLRRDAPDKWAEALKARRSQMTPEQLAQELQTSGQDLTTRAQTLQQQAADLNSQVAAHTQQLDTLSQQAAQRRSQGIPAGEIVSYQNPDGSVEHWPKDLAKQREDVQARLADTQSQQSTARAQLQVQAQELQKDAQLHDESAKLLHAAHEGRKAADLSHLSFIPGHEQTAKEIQSLDSEAETRMADLKSVWGDNPPPEAIKALDEDITQRKQQSLAMGDARNQAAKAAFDGIQQKIASDPEKYTQQGPLWVNARKNLSEALGIPELEAEKLIEDQQATHDWDTALGRYQEEMPSEQWKSYKNALSDDSDPRKTRVLHNGGIAVNPSITDEKKYAAAVEAADATPEAKAAAMAQFPARRAQAGENVLHTIQEIEGTFGKDSIQDWTDFKAKKPKDVSEQDWALKFAEKAKSDSDASPFTSLLKQVTRSAAQGVYDLRQQASALAGGITGSETMMSDAAWAARKANALELTKNLDGTTSNNFVSRGLFDQLPRLAGSLIPAAGGAKLVQGGLKLFAATSFGARFFPALAAVLNKAATPAQAVQAVTTLTRAGVGGAAAAGAAQTYGSQLSDIYSTLRKENPDLTHAQALHAAQMPAILSAGVTALLTTAGGAHGIEKLLASPAAAKELFRKQFTSQLARAGFLASAFAKGATKEWFEEISDELFSQYQAAVASHPKDPHAGTKAIAQFMQQLPELSVAIGILGGAGEGIQGIRESSIQHPASSDRSSLPETQAAAWAAIKNHRHLDAQGVEAPDITQATQQRAALALATAQGGDLFDATEQQLNAAGWTRRDSKGADMAPGKYARLKDYTGPNVLNIDQDGHAHIDPQYHESLKQHLPAVAAAIPDEATRPAPSEQPSADTGTTPAGQNPQNGPGPDANASPVPTPAQSGPESAPSGSPPAQSGTPVASEASAEPPARATSSSTQVPSTEKSIADWLVDRHMPDAEAAAAAKAIVAHPDMAGKDFDHFHRQIDARNKILKSIGITGAATKSQSASNPLRFNKTRVVNGGIEWNAADLPNGDPKPQPERVEKARDILQANESEINKDGTYAWPSAKFDQNAYIRRNRYLNAVNLLSKNGFSSNEANTILAGFGFSDPLSSKTSSSHAPKSKITLPAALQQKLDDSIADTPERTRVLAAAFAWIKKQVQAKELTEEQAAAFVAKYTGATTPLVLRQALETHLGWNTPRALAAAHAFLDDKSNSSIPLAAADKAANRVPAKGNAGTATITGSAGLGPDAELAAGPAALRQNADYARSRLATLAAIKDPTKKAWARHFLTLFEKGFEKHHLLYDAIATGAAARKYLDGQFTAVMVIDGKVTRLIDLDAMMGQFAHIESPAAALRFTGIEEDTHAMVQQLARQNPSKYGYKALVAKWKALPAKLKQTVWQAYRAINQNTASADQSKLPTLTQTQEWHMMNEFLRMLVQDRHFAGQITESVDASPSLIQWVKDLLADLGNILRNLLKSAPPALQSDLNAMVDEIGQRLKEVETRSANTTGTLERLPTLADTQAVTAQALGTLMRAGQGILSEPALARIWDQLDPALQHRVFSAKDRAATTGRLGQRLSTRAPKHELMQELLTQLITDPAAAQALLDAPEKSTHLLQRIFQGIVVPASAGSGISANKPLAALHAQTLRLLGAIHGVQFVQQLPSTPQVQAMVEAEPPQPGDEQAAAAGDKPAQHRLRSRRWLLSQVRIKPGTPPPTSSALPSPAPKGSAVTPDRSVSENPASSIQQPASSLPPPAPSARAQASRAQHLAALISLIQQQEAADLLDKSFTERRAQQDAEDFNDHNDASSNVAGTKLRAKFRLQQVAATRARFFLLDNATRELHQAETAGRQDVEKAAAMLALAMGRIGQRRSAASWRTIGRAELRQLALLGIGVDQHPHTESGGYPYTLSRIEAAELRREFSLEGTAERQIADEELDWMRQQPAQFQTAIDDLAPAYIEKNRDIPILKQSALDGLALSYPHTSALIRPEWQTRQAYGLRVDARSPASKQTAPVEGRDALRRVPDSTPDRAAITQQPELPAQPQSPTSGNPASSIQQRASKPITFDVPVKGEGTITASFPDTASREAFQFKHDLARSRKLASGPERTKLEASLSALKARFMADLGLGDDAVTTKLAAYHEHVVSTAAEHAAKNRIGGITAPQFEAFSGGHAAPSTKSLPAPVGGDLIADLSRYGIGRISSTPAQGKAGDLDWFKTVTDGTAGPHKQAAIILAVKAADAGELSTPLARRIWLAGTAGLGLTPAQARWERPGHVLAPNGMAIDAAATTLSSQQADGSGTPYQFDSADALGHAILSALDARIAAKAQHANPSIEAEADTQEQSRNFATLISGNQSSGQSMTGSEIAAQLDPDSTAENTLKLGTAWFTVDAQDDTGLHLTASGPDAHLYGQQTLAPDQSYPVTQINDRSLSDSSATRSNIAERSTIGGATEAIRAANAAFVAALQSEGLMAAHRIPPEQIAQAKEEMAENATDKDYHGGNAWLTPDNTWINLGEESHFLASSIVHEKGYGPAMAAGYVRIVTETYASGTREIFAEFFGPLTRRIIRNVRDAALLRGINPDNVHFEQNAEQYYGDTEEDPKLPASDRVLKLAIDTATAYHAAGARDFQSYAASFAQDLPPAALRAGRNYIDAAWNIVARENSLPTIDPSAADRILDRLIGQPAPRKIDTRHGEPDPETLRRIQAVNADDLTWSDPTPEPPPSTARTGRLHPPFNPDHVPAAPAPSQRATAAAPAKPEGQLGFWNHSYLDYLDYRAETPHAPDGSPMSRTVAKGIAPYLISGNKGDLVGLHGNFYLELAQGSNGVLDAFGGAAIYTHFLASQNALTPGSVWNEWEYSRAVTNRQIRDNPAAVVREVISMRNAYRQAFPLESLPPDYDSMLKTREQILAWVNQQTERIITARSLDEMGRLPIPDTAEAAALYLFLQSHMTEGRVTDFDLNPAGLPRPHTSGKENGKDDFKFISAGDEDAEDSSGSMPEEQSTSADDKSGKVVDWETPWRIWSDKLPGIIRDTSLRLKQTTVRHGDGWQLAADAPADALVFVDTSYFPSDEQIAMKKKVMNYGRTTLGDGNPLQWFQKFRHYLLPKGDSVRYVITNNFNSQVIEMLEQAGWSVLQSYRGSLKSPSYEFIALSPAAAESIRLRKPAARRFYPGGLPRPYAGFVPSLNRGIEGEGRGLPAGEPVQTGERDPQSSLSRPAGPRGSSRSGRQSALERTLSGGPNWDATTSAQIARELDEDSDSNAEYQEALAASAPHIEDADLESDLEEDFAEAARRFSPRESTDEDEDSAALPAAPRTVEHVEPGFYSALAEAIRAKMPARSTPATVVGILKNAGIKTEELKWTGILPWLQQQAQDGPITQQQVLDYLKDEGSVHLQEIENNANGTRAQQEKRRRVADLNEQISSSLPQKAMDAGMSQLAAANLPWRIREGSIEPDQLPESLREEARRLVDAEKAWQEELANPSPPEPKYSQYQLPGGENYREVVLSMPEKPEPTKGYYIAKSGGYFNVYDGRRGIGQFETMEEAQSFLRSKLGPNLTKQNYTSSHFPDVPNYVAHMRLNDRTDASGHPGTFIEEIQSDRHQAGREKGYVSEGDTVTNYQVKQFPDGAWGVIDTNRAGADMFGRSSTEAEALAIAERSRRSQPTINDRIPDAPFRTTWPLQMFKRALVDAVASGKSWIGWTTGSTQAQRYDLSKQISTLYAVPDASGTAFNLSAQDASGSSHDIARAVPAEKLPDYVGKDLAHRILTAPAPNGIYTGTDLQVGGEGMKGFYDQILPKEIGKYVKQWGGKVESSAIRDTSALSSIEIEEVRWKSGLGEWEVRFKDDTIVNVLGDDAATGEEAAEQASEIRAARDKKLGLATWRNKQTPIWRINITPQMKAGVESGQALFAAPRRAYESMSFDPPFHTPFGDILSYDWMNQPVGGLSSQRTSDWSRARTNPATGRDIVHHFKVRKPDGIHTVSLETALGQLTEPQRHKLQSLIKSEQRRREESAAGQMTLFAAQRTPLLEAIDRIQDWYSTTSKSDALEYLPQDLQQQIEADPRWLWLDSHDATEELPQPNWYPAPYHDLAERLAILRPKEETDAGLTASESKELDKAADKLADWEINDGPKNHIIDSYQPEIDARLESTIEAIEATGRWEWTKENYFVATDEDPTQVLYASPRVTDPPFSTQESKTLENTRIHAIDTYLHGKRRPIADTPPADQAGSSRAQLQALLQHVRRSQRPSGPPAGNEQARIAEARRHDKTLLINWARNAGVLLSETPDRYPLNSPQDKGGREHHVFHDTASNRWVKITKGDGSAFGFQPLDEGKNDEWMISQDHADVVSYLEKLALQNQVFHDDIVLHGVIADPLGKVALIISQPHYKGTFAGVYTAIKPAMADAGFVRIEPPSARFEDPSAYYRPSDNLAVVDMHDQNAILEDNGTFLRVFDNIMLHPTGALRATFERLAAKRQALPAAQRVAQAAATTDPNPSDAQKEAGNYAKGKVTLHGLRLSIENPRGSIRSGTDASGKPWSVTMPHHYGYFLGTEGKDGDHVDFFLGPNPDSQQVLIVNQRKVSNGHFDEHKIMLGFDSPAQAAKAYLSAYTPGWKGLQSAIPTTLPVLKEWLTHHDTTLPVTRESIAKIAKTLPAGSDSGIPLLLHSLAKNSAPESPLPASARIETLAKSLDKTVTTAGKVANLIPKAVGKTIAAVTGTGQHIPGHAAMARASTALGQADAAAAAKVGTTVANALQRVSGKDIRRAPDAVAAWLGKPDGLGSWVKNTVVDQLLPTALMPREWLALSHEMQRKTAFGAEKSNDLIRALSGNPRLSDLAYPKEFAENPQYREQLFDAMENKIPWSSLPPAMQALGTKLRQMLRETGLELVKQGIMHPDTFEDLQANGWMPRYMLEEAQESAGSVLAAFKLGVKDLLQQRSTAFHIVDTTRKGKDGQPVTVNRQEGGRNAWRFRDAASRDAFYSDFIRRQALDMLQDTHGNTKEVQTMMAALDSQQRRDIRAQIKTLTRADMDTPQKLSPALAGMVKAAIEHQKATYKKENPFDPPKLIKDPVYSIARYILAQTHNAATMELLQETAKNKDWTSNVSLQGFTQIPDATRFGPLAGKFVQNDIAQQILDKMDVPNAALRFYDAVLRKWKSGKLVWNPGSHIRDAVGNTVFAYLGGSNIANPGNWPYYRQAMEIMRNGGPLYTELLEHGVLGGDAYSSLVREKLKGLLPDAKTVENFNPGLLQRFFFDFGAKFHATHEQLAEYRRVPDDFYKIAAYLKAKAEFISQSPHLPVSLSSAQAAAHVRKWFPYYDRLGGSATTRAAGRFVNPFLSFFRESTRILALAAKERPIALTAALAFPAALSAINAMLLGLDDRDRDEVNKDLSGRGKGIIGLSSLHLFSMLLPFRSSQGQVQQFDISAIMPFADLLGQKVVPLEDKENAWQTFWRQTASAGPIGNLGVSWITNRDLFSGRHLTESDMSTPEMLSAYAQHAAGVALPPLAPDLAHLVGIGQGGALSRAGERQTNKTLQTYDPLQTLIRSVFGMNVKTAAPNLYRQAEDFRKAQGYDAQPDFDYGTTATSRVKRALVREISQDTPNKAAIKNLKDRLKALGVPLDTDADISKVLKIIDPAQIIGGSKKQNLSAADARQRFRQSLPPESRQIYEQALRDFAKIQQRAPLLLRSAQ